MFVIFLFSRMPTAKLILPFFETRSLHENLLKFMYARLVVIVFKSSIIPSARVMALNLNFSSTLSYVT